MVREIGIALHSSGLGGSSFATG